MTKKPNKQTKTPKPTASLATKMSSCTGQWYRRTKKEQKTTLTGKIQQKEALLKQAEMMTEALYIYIDLNSETK